MTPSRDVTNIVTLSAYEYISRRRLDNKMHDHSPRSNAIARSAINCSQRRQYLVDAVNNDRAHKTHKSAHTMVWDQPHQRAGDITYLDCQTRFVQNNTRKQSTMNVHRPPLAYNPESSWQIFLCTLLTPVNRSTSYEHLQTYDGVQHETFKAICIARGSWIICWAAIPMRWASA